MALKDDINTRYESEGEYPNIMLDGKLGHAAFGGGRIGFDGDGSGWLARGNIQWDELGNLDVSGRITAGNGSSIGGMILDDQGLYGSSATFYSPLVYDLSDPASIIQTYFKKNQNFILYGDVDDGSYHSVILPSPVMIGNYDFSIKILVRFDSPSMFALVPFTGSEIRDNNGNIYQYGSESANYASGCITMEKGDVVELYYHDKVYYLSNHRY